MPDARPAARAPWIVAGVAGVVFVVLLVVFFVPLAHARDSYVPGQLTGDEQQALDAAATEIANLTFSRAHFDADYARALAGSTGVLHKDLKARRPATLKVLTQGKFDLTSKATHEALVGPTTKGHGYVVLVTVSGYKSNAPTVPVRSDLQVTVVRENGKYLVENLSNIGLG